MHGLRTLVLYVDDLTAATAWYREVLGQDPHHDTPYYVGFDVGGYELGLHPSDENHRPGVGGNRAYWGVDDCAAEIERLIGLGATALEPAQDVGGGIVIGAVRDPTGNALGVVQNPHFHAGAVTVVRPGEKLAATPGDVSDQSVVHEVVVPATPAQVWPLWTTTEGITSWLVDRARVELAVGGPFEVYFQLDAPEGSRGSEGCRVLSWLPERMVSFTWNAPPHLETTRLQHTWVVVELEPEGDGTRVRITHLGWPASGLADPGSEWPATFAYFERAWGQVTAALAARLGR